MKTRFAAVIALLAVVGTIGLVSCNKSQAPRQGQTIKHTLGYDIHIETPTDFMGGVTDHFEYVRVTKQANTPATYVSKPPEAQPLIMKNPNDPAEQQRVFLYLLSLTSEPPIKSFMSPSGGPGMDG